MCPLSYAAVSSSTSITRMASSPRCSSSHAVSTSAPGLAYSAMNAPSSIEPVAGLNPMARIGILRPTGEEHASLDSADLPRTRSEEPQGRLGLLRHHLGVHAPDPLDARQELSHLRLDEGSDRTSHRRERVRYVDDVALELDAVHQAEVDDVDAELGVRSEERR